MLLTLHVALATEVPGNKLIYTQAGYDFTKASTIAHLKLLNYLIPSLINLV